MKNNYVLLFAVVASLLFTACSFEEDIHRAAYDGKLDQVKTYVERGGKLDTLLFESNYTLLEYATMGGRIDVMKYLIFKSNDKNKLGDEKRLMYLAAKSGNIDAAKLLVKRGLNVNDEFGDGSYLESGFPLLVASQNRDYGMMSYLISKGANVNAKDKNGTTPLIEAIFYSHQGNPFKCVKLLVEKGADVNQADNKGSSPLALAALAEHQDIVKYLVQKGADINKRGEEGETALTYAAGEANSHLFDYFVKLGADQNVRLDDGSTVLMQAVSSSNVDFVKSLRTKYGYSIEAKDTLGQNILLYAVKQSDEKMIVYAVDELKFDVNSVDYSYKTPLMLAAEALDLGKIKLLLKYGGKINAQDKNGLTPLMYSAISSYYDESVPKEDEFYEVIKYLIDSGARVDIKDKSGSIALDYVKDKQLPKIIELLKQSSKSRNYAATK
jgi:ankyrin repeat protein